MAKVNYGTGHGYSHYGLVETSDVLLKLAERDLEHFLNFGITPEYLDDCRKKTSELKSTDKADSNKAEKVLKTKEKNDKFKELKAFLKQIRMMLLFDLKNKPENNSHIFKKPLRAIKQNDLLNNAFDTLRMLKENEDLLTTSSVKSKITEQLENLYNQAKALLSDQSMVFAKSGNSSAKRALLKEEVYTFMQHISKIGKFYWEDKNPARYRQYKITPKPKRGRKKKSDDNLP